MIGLGRMGWLETIGLGLLGLYVALRLVLAVTIFVTSLIEVRRVCSLVPAEPEGFDDNNFPANREDFNPYREPGTPEETYLVRQNRKLADLGFLHQGRYRQEQGGIYQGRFDFWLSDGGEVLALVLGGTTAKVKLDKTILYTMTDDGRYLISSDKPTGVTAPAVFDNEIFWQMDLDRLLDGHLRRIAESARAIRPFPPGGGFAGYRSMRTALVESWAAHGEVRYLEPERATFRSTLKGAFLAVFRSFKIPKIHRA